MMEIFIGNHERVIGRRVYVKVRNEFVSGTVKQYNFKSRTYVVCCEDKKTRKVKTLYVG